MKIDIYKPVVLFLLPAVLAGCSGEREPFPQGREGRTEDRELLQPWRN